MSNERDAYRVLQVDPDAHEVVVKAAYRALAALYHPDRDPSALATHRMAELNDAYAKVRTRERRDGYDRLRTVRHGHASESVVVAGTGAQTGGPNGRSGAKHGAGTLDFGRYAGWSIQQLATHDPDYLVWLSRHSSGIRYRRTIEELLARTRAERQPIPDKGKKRR
jgi:DnaJ-class molecular chaperone